MKLSFRYFLFVILATGIFSACKKDSDSDANNKAMAKVLGKWTFVSASTNDHYSNADHIKTLAGAPGDFMEFMNNGKATLRLFSSQDTSKYTLVGGSKLIFDDVDQFGIKTLTETDLILNRKIVYSSAAYKEETYTLRR